MFGIGFQEMAFLAVIALLVFGPKRLPELARTLGKGMAEFRRASADLRGALSMEPDANRPPPPRPKTDEDERDLLGDRDYQPAPAQTIGGPDPAAEAAVMAELADESNDELHREETEETAGASSATGASSTADTGDADDPAKDPARSGRDD